MEVLMKKTEGQKSRDTVPLRISPRALEFFLNFSLLMLNILIIERYRYNSPNAKQQEAE
jgi:hypothetical protein